MPSSLMSAESISFITSYIAFIAGCTIMLPEPIIASIFTIIGIISMLCCLFLTFNLKMVFDKGLTASEYDTAKILMLLLGINMAISFPMSVFTTIISANERFVFLKILGMVRTVLSPLVTLPLLIIGYRSIAVVSVALALSVGTDLCYFLYVKTTLKNKFIFHGFEKGLFKSLFTYTGFIAINIIVDQVNWNIDKFLLGRYKGTEVVAVYAVGYSLYQYYMMMSTAISGVFAPRIHHLVNNTKDAFSEQRRQCTELFVKVGRIQFLILGLVASGVIFFGKAFIYYWAGPGYEEAYFVALLLILPASIALIQNIGIELQRAMNKHRFRSYCYLAMAIINLALSIFLCQRYGAVGAAFGTAVSLIIANGLVMNIYYHKACNLDVISFWKNILSICVGMVIPVGFGILIMKFIALNSLVYLLLFIAIYTVIYCGSMWLIGMNNYEKSLVRKAVRSVFHVVGGGLHRIFRKNDSYSK